MTKLFDSPIEHEVPVLVQLAEPAKLLKVGDLSDLDHPVNNKSLSGKRKGDAVNIRCALFPVAAQSPITIKLSQFKFSPDPAFTGYLENAPQYAGEKHLEIDDEFKQLTQDNQGFASLRYTINNTPTPMPSGILGKGLADIQLDTSIHQIAGSGASGGEGAIKFITDGTARISTSVNIFNETGTDNEVTFWFAIFNGSTWDKIPESETSITVTHQMKVDSTTKNEHNLATFNLTAEAGMRIGLFAQASVADGAYLEAVTKIAPLLQTDIEFKELTAVGADDPWADVDLTSFDNVYTRQVFADKIVSGSQTATFTLDLPVGGTFDILNVLGSLDGTYSTISPQEYSFSWDSTTNTAVVDFKRNGDYRIFFVLMLP